MDFWPLHIPVPLALAVVAALGYLFGRRGEKVSNDLVLRSRRELRRARSVANELERIAWTVRKSLASHHASVGKFKDRVAKLGEQQEEIAWRELCRESEEILRPTLQLATQIANAYDEIRQQTAHLMTFTEIRTDPLTGVNNRRGLDDAMASQFAMMTRYEFAFAVALFDIDRFKEVNDRDGHLYGDRILQELAQLFDECVRETDLVARYGGEEFVIVMPQTELEGACILNERLRLEIEQRMPVTVSGGVAAALDGDTEVSLLARADAALYSAKTAGRNKVFMHNGDQAEPVVLEEAAAAQF